MSEPVIHRYGRKFALAWAGLWIVGTLTTAAMVLVLTFPEQGALLLELVRNFALTATGLVGAFAAADSVVTWKHGPAAGPPTSFEAAARHSGTVPEPSPSEDH